MVDTHHYNIHPEERPASESIDLEKVWFIVRKNSVWIFLIILLANTAAYLYVRYTRPVYESSSVIKLDIKSEANILGIENVSQSLDDMAGEIELLKSNMFFSRVIEAIDMRVNYYAYGRVIFQERYQNSPFKVAFEILDPAYYDRPIDVEILNEEQFVLSYGPNDSRFSHAYTFGEEITTPHFHLLVELTEEYTIQLDNSRYYFVINSQQALLSYLSQNMIVAPVNFNANTIRVGFQGYDRQKVKDLVHVIDSVYLQYTQEKKNQATEQKLTFLDEQLNTIEQKLSKYESYFENFTIHNKTNNLSSEIGETIAKMEALDAKKYELLDMQETVSALSEKVSKEETILAEPGTLANVTKEVFESIRQLNQLINEKALMLGSYKENTFAVKRKEQQITLLKKDVTAILQKYSDELSQEIKNINRQKAQMEEDFVKLPSQETQYSKNQRYHSLYEEIFLSLVQKKNELEITKAGTVTDFVVLLPATVPNSPVAPESMIVYGIGATTGLLLSLIFVAMGYIFNNKINSQSELERYISAPVLGTVPYASKTRLKAGKLVVSQSPNSSVSEAFRAIRTNIQFMGIQNNRKVISVTSTISAEGKTFFASNLGYIMAMTGKKVVLVDVDLRRPKVHTVFNHENNLKGVSTFLIGEYALEECIRSTGTDGYDFITAGPIPPNPSELIGSEPFTKMIEQLKSQYDVVILDTPPVGLVTDGLLVMEQADLPVYVFRADYSKKAFIKTLERVQKTGKARHLSVVLNSLTSDRGYGYHANGYGYYHDDAEKTAFPFLQKLLGKSRNSPA